MEARIRHLADYDTLTGVANRRRLLELLSGHIERSDREGDPLALVMLDLDNFKFTNDTYGHARGDAMLKATAQTLLRRTRQGDVVARLGGDEFAVVLPSTTQRNALVVARDIRKLLSAVRLTPPITASFGVTSIDGGPEITADEMLVNADTAMYDAKEHGGDRVCVYAGRTSGSLSWVQQIRSALTNDRFVLFGQPIIDLATGRVTHHELLVRMRSDDGSQLIPPAAFIPTAERFGLIHEIDRWVLREGLRIAAERPVAINLSGYSTDEGRVIEAVRRAIAAGLDPSHLTFEVTETAAMINLPAAQTLVTALQDLGCAIALDDFGTGFGSFTYLKHIPNQFLKIDIEFVRQIETNRADQQIVSAIVDVAHKLEKLTIAEGVESAEALAIVKKLGVDYAQGFYIGRPAPIPEHPPAAADLTRKQAKRHDGPPGECNPSPK